MEACKASDDAAPDDGFPVCDSGDSGYTELNPAHHLRVEVVLSLLRQDYSKSWSAATLAKKARLTERQLQAAFKSVYGKNRHTLCPETAVAICAWIIGTRHLPLTRRL